MYDADGVDRMQVFLIGPQVEAFREWVASKNCHLEGPISFSEDDPEDTTWFMRPGRTPEEFAQMMRGR